MLDYLEAQLFLYREARLMDTHAYDEWLSLWASSAHYWIPCNADDLDVKRHVSLVNEDRTGLEDRVSRLKSGAHYAQDPKSRLSRVVSNVIIECVDSGSGDVVVRSKFHVVEYRLDVQRYFAGKYRHHLKSTADGYKIELQRVDLANVEGPFDYVLQTWL